MKLTNKKFLVMSFSFLISIICANVHSQSCGDSEGPQPPPPCEAAKIDTGVVPYPGCCGYGCIPDPLIPDDFFYPICPKIREPDSDAGGEGVFEIRKMKQNGTIVNSTITFFNYFGDEYEIATGIDNNLYLTLGKRIVVYDPNLNFIDTFATGFSYAHSLVFDNSGNLYVADSNDVKKYDSNGNFLGIVLNQSVLFMDLKSDQCTMLWTSGDAVIHSHNVCTNTPLPAFYTSSELISHFKVRPNGEVIVIQKNHLVNSMIRLNASGNVIQNYSVPQVNSWTCVGVDPDGISFWGGDANTQKLYRFDIETGYVFTSFAVKDNYAQSMRIGFPRYTTSSSPIISVIDIHTLYLTALIEGLYNEESDEMISDNVKVYLAKGYAPYPIVDSSMSVLNSKGAGIFNFQNTIKGVPYYIGVKHRNSIETWSSEMVYFDESTPVNYDFTSNSNLIKHKDNMVLKGKRWCIYSGDVNQDGTIDGSDISLIDNDALNFVNGYVSTDVNGDGIVDGADASITDNNAFNFISAWRPFDIEPAPQSLPLDLDKIKNFENNQKDVRDVDTDKKDTEDKVVPEEKK